MGHTTSKKKEEAEILRHKRKQADDRIAVQCATQVTETLHATHQSKLKTTSDGLGFDNKQLHIQPTNGLRQDKTTGQNKNLLITTQ